MFIVCGVKAKEKSDKPKNLLYKRQLCRHWLNGQCRKSQSECEFAHGKSDLLQDISQVPCASLKRGERCRYGIKVTWIPLPSFDLLVNVDGLFCVVTSPFFFSHYEIRWR